MGAARGPGGPFYGEDMRVDGRNRIGFIPLSPISAPVRRGGRGASRRGAVYSVRSISDATSPPRRITSEVTYIHRRRTMIVPSRP